MPTPGSFEESEAIRVHYEANRERFRGNYAAAVSEYRQNERDREPAADESGEVQRYMRQNPGMFRDLGEAQRHWMQTRAQRELQRIKYEAMGDSQSYVMRYATSISPEIVKQANGKYTLKRIPIFECHDREDIHCDDTWMYTCAANQKQDKAHGFLPRLIIGHNSDHPGAPEKPADAALDNYQYDPADRWFYADFVDVDEKLLSELKSNKWPGRSVEANRTKPAIDVVALLGGSPPYFKLPDIRYNAGSTVSLYAEVHMGASASVTEWRKLYNGLRKAYNIGENGNPERAEEMYRKFCQLMERYEREHANEPNSVSDLAKASK